MMLNLGDYLKLKSALTTALLSAQRHLESSPSRAAKRVYSAEMRRINEGLRILDAIGSDPSAPPVKELAARAIDEVLTRPPDLEREAEQGHEQQHEEAVHA